MKALPFILTAIILPIVGCGVIGAVVWAIRLAIWKSEVPRAVSRLRWVIGILLAIAAIIAEVCLGMNTSTVTILNAALAYFTAEALRAPRTPKNKSAAARPDAQAGDGEP